jgi:uncharacterized protein
MRRRKRSSAVHRGGDNKAQLPAPIKETSMRILAALVPLLVLSAWSVPASADSPAPIVSVDGRGEVMAPPDTAYINSGVTTQAATAREALDANTAAMNELFETLAAAGIARRDIQTSGFSVHPNYVYSDARDASGYTRPPRISGYQVSNSVSVRVRDLDSLGTVLDRAVEVGANTISGVSFSVADPSSLLDDARALAFADARAKAELYAGIAGLELDTLRSIREDQRNGPPQPMEMQAMAYDRAASAVPVAEGELAFVVTVQVTWELDADD